MRKKLYDLEKFISFLEVDNLDFAEIERDLAIKISNLLDCRVRCSFLCPGLKLKSRDMYITYDTAAGYTNSYIGGKELENLEREKGLMRIIKVDQFSKEIDSDNNIIISLDITINQDEFLFLEQLILEFLNKVLKHVFFEIRRRIIASKSTSTDINSFLYKLFRHPNNLNRMLGVEGCSVFLKSPLSAMLRLRGTTGLESGASLNDISFHKDHNTNIAGVYKENSIRAQFGDKFPLTGGVSTERVQGLPYAKLYLPIRLRENSVLPVNNRRPRIPIGVMRLVNSNGLNKEGLPFSWIYLAVGKYCAESLHNVLSAYFLAEEKSFKKDEAYHGASGAVDTIVKNINFVRRYLFDDIEPFDNTIPRKFLLNPTQKWLHANANDIKLLLNTAHANANSLSFQIERANIELLMDSDETTNKLITDVILRAEATLKDRCLMHHAREPLEVQSAKELIKLAGYSPPLRGSPQALTSIFVNLYENSVKYRVDGSPIKIQLDFERGWEYYTVRFRDYGIGILPEEEEIIFDRDFRTNRAKEKTVSGGGIGLAHCREIINHYGGTIKAKSLSDGLEIILNLAIA